MSSNYADLKSLIQVHLKDGPLFGVFAPDLILWKVKKPVAVVPIKTLPRRVVSMKLEEIAVELKDDVDTVSKVFTDIMPNHLQLIVQKPSSVTPDQLFETRKQRRNYVRQFPSDVAPSVQGRPNSFNLLQRDPKTCIWWNRPPSVSQTVPPTLLHPVFGTFIDDCEKLAPTKTDNALVFALSDQMSKFFGNEMTRTAVFWDILEEHGIETTSDYTIGSDMPPGGYRYVIGRVKDEITSSGAEPYCQAILRYLQITQSSVFNYVHFRFPCILISVLGGHVSFSAAVWGTRPNIQVLSTALPLFWHPTDIRMRATAARHFAALRNAIRSLKQCYEALSSQILFPTPITLDYPYACSYTCMHTGSEQYFTYESQPSPAHLRFVAITAAGEKIYIKFTSTYSEDAHTFCASRGFAPALKGVKDLPGGWRLVAMELIWEDYICLADIYTLADTYTPLYAHFEDITASIKSLHDAEFVHGEEMYAIRTS